VSRGVSTPIDRHTVLDQRPRRCLQAKHTPRILGPLSKSPPSSYAIYDHPPHMTFLHRAIHRWLDEWVTGADPPSNSATPTHGRPPPSGAYERGLQDFIYLQLQSQSQRIL
jgi:hypothetical protein